MIRSTIRVSRRDVVGGGVGALIEAVESRRQAVQARTGELLESNACSKRGTTGSGCSGAWRKRASHVGVMDPASVKVDRRARRRQKGTRRGIPGFDHVAGALIPSQLFQQIRALTFDVSVQANSSRKQPTRGWALTTLPAGESRATQRRGFSESSSRRRQRIIGFGLLRSERRFHETGEHNGFFVRCHIFAILTYAG
jgi:hypothetical protein